MSHSLSLSKLKDLFFFILNSVIFLVLLWIALTFLLSPFLGHHYEQISFFIQERADFLKQYQVKPSPSLKYFQESNFSIKFGVGSLYSFFFFSFPIALWLSIWEMLVQYLKGNWRILVRGSAWFLFIYFYALPLSAFIFHWAYGVYFILCCFLSSYFGAKWVYYISWRSRLNPKKFLGFTFTIFIVLLLPYIIHPVIHIVTSPEDYKNVNKLTLIRDWALLNEEGKNVINDWYYKYSPYASEMERITAFQPLVVGVLKIEKQSWFSYFKQHFVEGRGVWGQRLVIVQIDNFSEGVRALKNGWLDYLAIGEEYQREDLSGLETCEPDSFAFFVKDRSVLLSSAIQKYSIYDKKNYWGGVQNWFGKKVYSTPLTRRIDKLRERGFIPAISEQKRKMKSFLAQVLSREKLRMLLLLFLGMGTILLLGYVMFSLSEMLTFLPWLIILLLLLFTVSHINQNFSFWEEKGKPVVSDNIFLRIKRMHLAWSNSDYNIEEIIKKDFDPDFRIAMWELALLGRHYLSIHKDGQKMVEQKFLLLTKAYPSWPVNCRYKFVEAISKIPFLHRHLEELLKKEEHLYVRWYAEMYGFDGHRINKDIFKH